MGKWAIWESTRGFSADLSQWQLKLKIEMELEALENDGAFGSKE
jgi:hypothetical protein